MMGEKKERGVVAYNLYSPAAASLTCSLTYLMFLNCL